MVQTMLCFPGLPKFICDLPGLFPMIGHIELALHMPTLVTKFILLVFKLFLLSFLLTNRSGADCGSYAE